MDCEELNGPLIGYEYKIIRDGEEIVVRVDSESTTCVYLLNMTGVADCSVSVAAINEAGVGKYCPPVNVDLDEMNQDSSTTEIGEGDIGIVLYNSDTQPSSEENVDEMIVSIQLTGKLELECI